MINRDFLKKLIKYWLFPVLWLGVIFFMSSLQTVRASHVYWKEFVIKKTAHIVEYATLSFSLYRALRQDVDNKRAGIYALVFCVLYAISDEFHQSFTPGREPTLRDVIFDTIGASLAIVLSWKFIPKAPPRLKSLAKKLELI